MLQNVIRNNGFSVSVGGLLIVFGGLVLIACAIFLFSRILEWIESGEKCTEPKELPGDLCENRNPSEVLGLEEIPETDCVAIAALIELYRRVHFDTVQSEITFVHGNDAQNAWRLGFKYGQRRGV